MAILIDLISGETINQNFTSTQQQCSYKVLFQDTTTITPIEYDRGKIEYFLLDSNNIYQKIVESAKEQSVFYDFCSAGIYSIKQLLTIREIPNCGGTSPIIYQSDIINTVTVLEYKPDLNLPGIENCIIRDKATTLDFTFVMNSNVCGALSNEFKIDILESPSGSTVTGVTLSSFSSPYTWSVTFNKIGTYLLNVSVQNCCYKTVKTLEINVCDPIQIKADCCKCGVFYVNNYSDETVPYKVEKLYPEVNTFVTQEGQIEADKQITIETKEDGVFQITYTDVDNIEKVKLWYVFCKIDNCLNTILKNILCTDCSDCPSEPNLKDRERLNKITLLTQLYYKWIDDEMDGKSYALFPDNKLLDYNNRIKDLYQIDDIYNKILEICSNCANPSAKDCGCGCS